MTQKPISCDDYVTINTVDNALYSLETAAQFLARSDNFKWKWAAIALHHSLYSFCLACLVNGNPDNVLSSGKDDENHFCSKDEGIWFKSRRNKRPNSPGYTIEWVQTEENPPLPRSPDNEPDKPRGKIIGFWTALARAQDYFFWMGRNLLFKLLALSGEEWQSIEWLTKNIRNELIHFLPKIYRFPVADIQLACSDVLRPIEFLALESGTIIYLEDAKRKGIKTAISKLREGLDQPAGSV